MKGSKLASRYDNGGHDVTQAEDLARPLANGETRAQRANSVLGASGWSCEIVPLQAGMGASVVLTVDGKNVEREAAHDDFKEALNGALALAGVANAWVGEASALEPETQAPLADDDRFAEGSLFDLLKEASGNLTGPAKSQLNAWWTSSYPDERKPSRRTSRDRMLAVIQEAMRLAATPPSPPVEDCEPF